MLKKYLYETLILITLSMAVALGVNHFSPNGIPLKGQWTKGEGVVSARSLSREIEINDPQTVNRTVLNQERVILDVRSGDDYARGHIPGALSFPLSEFDDMFGMLMKLVDKTTPILVYCTGFECEDSHNFSNHLTGFGFTDVKVYTGGFTQWEEMGFEIETGQ